MAAAPRGWLATLVHVPAERRGAVEAAGLPVLSAADVLTRLVRHGLRAHLVDLFGLDDLDEDVAAASDDTVGEDAGGEAHQTLRPPRRAALRWGSPGEKWGLGRAPRRAQGRKGSKCITRSSYYVVAKFSGENRNAMDLMKVGAKA